MKRLGSIFLGTLAVIVAAAAALRPNRGQITASATPTARTVTAPRRRSMEGEQGDLAAIPEAGTVSSDVDRLDDAADIARALATRIKRHNTIMIAASLSYYALLAMFPAAIAAASIYGLVADPATLEGQVEELTAALPTKTAEFVEEQLNLIVDSSSSSLGVATTVSIVFALWSASAGTKALISAINHAYGERETRSFLALRGSALAVTLGLIIFGVAATAAVGFLPQILGWIGLEDAAATAISLLRWPIVIAIVILGLGALFKLAPNRPWRMTRWINFGAIMSAVLWVLATIGMSLYVNRFGSGLGETYGTLTGLIVLMLWFFVSGFVMLLGAETNSYLERHGAYAES